HSVIHFGGFSVEGPWDTILQANIIGCYNLFEAARQAGVKRVVFASSNHAVGFYPRKRKIGTDVTVRPDSRYGVSKAFGEALGAPLSGKAGIDGDLLRDGQCRPRWLGRAPVVDLVLAEENLPLIPYRLGQSRYPLRGPLRRVGQCSGLVGQFAR